jgi:hypothetical protein
MKFKLLLACSNPRDWIYFTASPSHDTICIPFNKRTHNEQVQG